MTLINRTELKLLGTYALLLLGMFYCNYLKHVTDTIFLKNIFKYCL